MRFALCTLFCLAYFQVSCKLVKSVNMIEKSRQKPKQAGLLASEPISPMALKLELSKSFPLGIEEIYIYSTKSGDLGLVEESWQNLYTVLKSRLSKRSRSGLQLVVGRTLSRGVDGLNGLGASPNRTVLSESFSKRLLKDQPKNPYAIRAKEAEEHTISFREAVEIDGIGEIPKFDSAEAMALAVKKSDSRSGVAVVTSDLSLPKELESRGLIAVKIYEEGSFAMYKAYRVETSLIRGYSGAYVLPKQRLMDETRNLLALEPGEAGKLAEIPDAELVPISLGNRSIEPVDGRPDLFIVKPAIMGNKIELEYRFEPKNALQVRLDIENASKRRTESNAANNNLDYSFTNSRARLAFIPENQIRLTYWDLSELKRTGNSVLELKGMTIKATFLEAADFDAPNPFRVESLSIANENPVGTMADKKAVLFFGTKDHNGALDIPPMETLNAVTCCYKQVDLVRIYKKEDISSFFAKHQEGEFGFVQFLAHGSYQKIELAENLVLSTKNSGTFFSNLGRENQPMHRMLSPNAHVNINGCSVGSIDGGAGNLIDAVSRSFPDHYVWGQSQITGQDTYRVVPTTAHFRDLLKIKTPKGDIPVIYGRYGIDFLDENLIKNRNEIDRSFETAVIEAGSGDFKFYNPETRQIEPFDATKMNELIDSVYNYSDLYSSFILDIFRGRVWKDSTGSLQVINPDDYLLKFFSKYEIEVKKENLIFVQQLRNGPNRAIYLENGKLRGPKNKPELARFIKQEGIIEEPGRYVITLRTLRRQWELEEADSSTPTMLDRFMEAGADPNAVFRLDSEIEEKIVKDFKTDARFPKLFESKYKPSFSFEEDIHKIEFPGYKQIEFPHLLYRDTSDSSELFQVQKNAWIKHYVDRIEDDGQTYVFNSDKNIEGMLRSAPNVPGFRLSWNHDIDFRFEAENFTRAIDEDIMIRIANHGARPKSVTIRKGKKNLEPGSDEFKKMSESLKASGYRVEIQGEDTIISRLPDIDPPTP